MNSAPGDKKDLLKISQLADKAGVSIPTVKHYVREGLLPRPMKTSRNMAYYSEADITRIRLVKKLQKEKYLPLDVIKRLMDTGASFDEELALGKAIFRTKSNEVATTAVKRSRIQKLTGYPLDKIDLLEEKGLVHPIAQDGSKAYLPEDVELIRIMKSRDAMGVPFDTSLATLHIYSHALTRAVGEDINYFVRNIMGDTPTRQAIRFITEADETLDRFIIAFRHKMLRQFSQKTIQALNRLSRELAVLNFLPVSGTELPDQPPKAPAEKLVYHLLKEDGQALHKGVSLSSLGKEAPHMRALYILGVLMSGESAAAMDLVQAVIPKPTALAAENTVAALAHLFSMQSSAGFSMPLFNIKKVFSHLERVEQPGNEHPLVHLFAHYVCGAVYVFLPGVFDTRHIGIELLSALKGRLDGIAPENLDPPAWLARTLDFEIVPALKVRINRFLAQGYLKTGDKRLAAACLDAVVNQADPDSEHAAWARIEKLKITE